MTLQFLLCPILVDLWKRKSALLESGLHWRNHQRREWDRFLRHEALALDFENAGRGV